MYGRASRTRLPSVQSSPVSHSDSGFMNFFTINRTGLYHRWLFGWWMGRWQQWFFLSRFISIMSSPNWLRKYHKSSGFRQKSTGFRPSSESSSPEQKRAPPGPYPIQGDDPASQYTLLAKLATGRFSTVHRAIHNDTKQIVAVKQIGTRACSPFRLRGPTRMSSFPCRPRGFR